MSYKRIRPSISWIRLTHLNCKEGLRIRDENGNKCLVVRPRTDYYFCCRYRNESDTEYKDDVNQDATYDYGYYIEPILNKYEPKLDFVNSK